MSAGPRDDRPAADTAAGAVSRRRLLGLGGTAGAAGLALAAGGLAVGRAPASAAPAAGAPSPAGDEQLAFHGAHQPGIAAPVQAHGWLTAFDLTAAAGRAGVIGLLKAWTAIAAGAMAGRPLSDDDAMAYGRAPASLTVTVGFGASLLRGIGLADQVPDALAPLPAFVGDRLDPARSDGDLFTLVAGNDGLVVVHALRALQRAAASVARQRWQMSGFTDSPGAMPSPAATPRNLMGQLDGTGNPRQGTSAFDQTVYVPDDGRPAWLRGGSYLVFRRIRMLLNAWDALSRTAQEQVIGRFKESGAPLSGGGEFTPPDYEAQNADGGLAIPSEAHIRMTAAQVNSGATILRRPFSYYDGMLADGSPDAGLLFLAFQADPRTGFTPIQQRLAEADTLSTFIRHEAGALFAVPPGCEPGGYLGQALLEGA